MSEYRSRRVCRQPEWIYTKGVAKTPTSIPPDLRRSQRVRQQVDPFEGCDHNVLQNEALRIEGQRRVDELAMILEGREQARIGRVSTIEDVVARLKAKGMLPAEFDIDRQDAGPAGA